mmetsp:Transcript_12611/g.32657  ORF Transcript_12611/g.32657 Transcript_12611/m.32657 type:complete len:307 (-) Transcript_12611:1798-2718(-)
MQGVQGARQGRPLARVVTARPVPPPQYGQGQQDPAVGRLLWGSPERDAEVPELELRRAVVPDGPRMVRHGQLRRRGRHVRCGAGDGRERPSGRGGHGAGRGVRLQPGGPAPAAGEPEPGGGEAGSQVDGPAVRRGFRLWGEGGVLRQEAAASRRPAAAGPRSRKWQRRRRLDRHDFFRPWRRLACELRHGADAAGLGPQQGDHGGLLRQQAGAVVLGAGARAVGVHEDPLRGRHAEASPRASRIQAGRGGPAFAGGGAASQRPGQRRGKLDPGRKFGRDQPAVGAARGGPAAGGLQRRRLFRQLAG